MEKEQRKATDVLLEMEAKMEVLLSLLRAQDLNIKILSNKLNAINELLTTKQIAAPHITVETLNTGTMPSSVDTELKNNIVEPDFNLLVEKEPKGFRRTSRSETYAGDDVYLNKPIKKEQPNFKYPVQIPKPSGKAEVIVPTPTPVPAPSVENPTVQAQPNNAENTVPVIQRVIDKNGKSIFMADVEIIDTSTQQIVSKTRTGATGKWQAALHIGEYKVFLRKKENLTKEKIESIQTINVTGQQSPFELQTMIIK